MIGLARACIAAAIALAGCNRVLGLESTQPADARVITSFDNNIVFVTSGTYLPTDFKSGLDAADAKCASAAQSSHLVGTFVAFLSTSTTDAIVRLQNARGWVRPDGKPVADCISDLMTQRMYYPPRLDETGNDIAPGEKVMVGDDADNCRNYTDPSAMIDYGNPYDASDWNGPSSTTCSQPLHLYCFGIDKSAPLAVTTTSGPRAFVTVNSFLPGPTALAGADALCASEAQGLSPPGMFKALLPTSTQSATARVGAPSAPWVRLDGAQLAKSVLEFQAGNWLTSLSYTAAHTDTSVLVYTGGALTTTQSAVHTCNDWTDAGGTGTAGESSSSDGHAINYSTGVTCDGSPILLPRDAVRRVALAAALAACGCDGVLGLHATAAADAPGPDARRIYPNNVVFATSSAYLPTSFGSDLAGADALCAKHATAARLDGAFVAFLATSRATAQTRTRHRARLGAQRRRAVRGSRVRSGRREALLSAPRRRDRRRSPRSAIWRRTGQGVTNCADYSDPNGTIDFGVPYATATAWEDATLKVSCMTAVHLYCFSTALANPLVVTPASGRRAFVTVGAFVPSGGLAGGDALCAQEASAGGLSGSFRALLGTSTATAISRFSLAGSPWVRRDGIAIADTPLVFASGAWRTSIAMTVTGQYTVTLVFTGGAIDQVNSVTQTCVDWTSSAANATVGQSYASDVPGASAAGSTCAGQPVYCLEQ